MKTPTLKEINKLVTFARNSNGALGVCDVKGDVEGDVEGNVKGNVKGDVEGDVWGNVKGDVGGNVKGNVYGNVRGNVKGGVDRAINWMTLTEYKARKVAAAGGSNPTEIQTTTNEIQTTINNNNTMKIKKRKLLKYLKEKVALFKREAEMSANDGDYELAHEQAVISRFLMYYLIDSIDEDFPEKEKR